MLKVIPLLLGSDMCNVPGQLWLIVLYVSFFKNERVLGVGKTLEVLFYRLVIGEAGADTFKAKRSARF